MRAVVKLRSEPGAIGCVHWPDPVPGEGDVLVEVEQAGVCSTDVAVVDGAHPSRRPLTPPFVLGHEAAGTVVAVGANVRSLSVGARVALQVIWGNPQSPETLRGLENLDPEWFQVGTPDIPGAFAELLSIPAERTVLLPDAVVWDDAVLLEPTACAVHVLEVLDVRVGETLVVVGPGPFGLLLCQLGRAAGAGRVIAIGVRGTDEKRLERARECGADTIVAYGGEVGATSREILELTALEGAHAVADCGGTNEATRLAIEVAARGGRVALFAYSRHLELDPLRDVVRKGVSLHGVSVSQRRHYGAALRMISAGQVVPQRIISSRRPLAEVSDAIEGMRARADSKPVLSIKPGPGAQPASLSTV